MDKNNPGLNKPHPVTRSLLPENQEAPIHFIQNRITPTGYFYRRNHMPYPSIDTEAFYLPVYGHVKRPLTFSYPFLMSIPYRSLVTVLECAGNKRAYFDPKTYGEQWEDGAISQGWWKGVSLRQLLSLTGVGDAAREVLFIGYDQGPRTDLEGVFNYARSLPMDKALHRDTIIAYEMNGWPIPYEHGFPLRLIVPEWYGMASVKWLKEIQVLDHKFDGPFQTLDYVYYPNKHDDEGAVPVTRIKINSIIQQPQNYSVYDVGLHEICGIAWTGQGTVTDVEISFDEGSTWNTAELLADPTQPYAWTNWKYLWEIKDKGEYTISCRAKDSFGNLQPREAQWNRKGYGYNAQYSIRVKIE